MSQTTAILAALIIAFLIFIVMRGELSQYLAVLGI